MSLYKEAEDKLKELDKIISDVDGTNKTLNESTLLISNSVSVIRAINSTLLTATKKIEEDQKQNMDLHRKLVGDLRDVMQGLSTSNIDNLAQLELRMNDKLSDIKTANSESNDKLTSEITSVVKEQEQRFTQLEFKHITGFTLTVVSSLTILVMIYLSL